MAAGLGFRESEDLLRKLARANETGRVLKPRVVHSHLRWAYRMLVSNNKSAITQRPLCNVNSSAAHATAADASHIHLGFFSNQPRMILAMQKSIERLIATASHLCGNCTVLGHAIFLQMPPNVQSLERAGIRAIRLAQPPPAYARCVHDGLRRLATHAGPTYLFKPLLHWLLPRDMHRLLLLDIDVAIVRDLRPLWAQFERFDQRAVLGIVREQSLLYQIGSGGALEGLNGGVQLMDLDAMRASREYNEELAFFASGRGGQIGYMGDQTLYAFMAARRPHLFHRLGCEWNRQLGTDLTNGYANGTTQACAGRCGILHTNHPHLKCLARMVQAHHGCSAWHTLLRGISAAPPTSRWCDAKLTWLARYVQATFRQHFSDCCTADDEASIPVGSGAATFAALEAAWMRASIGCRLPPWLCVHRV